jgi:lysophospholipase L1-like esterase
MIYKLSLLFALMGLAIPALAQTTAPADGVAAPTPLPPAALRNKNEPPRKPGQPTLWLVGDSTVKVSTPGQQGWGTPLAAMFDANRVRVINRAIGGRSSRTFITEGRWDAVLADAEKGDFVLIQFGHNDGGALSGDNRERGSIKGTGDETQDVTLTLGDNKDKPYTVHTYGWYMKKYATDAKAKGLTPIICSYIPHGPRLDRPFTFEAEPKPTGYRLWAEESAKATGAHYIDLYGLIWKTYAGKTPEQIKADYFTPDEPNNTHTSPNGAKHNAECVAEGIRSLKDLPLASFLKPADAAESTTKP